MVTEIHGTVNLIEIFAALLFQNHAAPAAIPAAAEFVEALLSDFQQAPFIYSFISRPGFLSHPSGFSRVFVKYAHPALPPCAGAAAAANTTFLGVLHGGTVGLLHLLASFPGLAGEALCNRLVTIGAQTIDNVAPFAGAAVVAVCGTCNAVLESASGLVRAPGGGAVPDVDSPALLFVTVSGAGPHIAGALPPARNLGCSPTAALYGRDYELVAAIGNNGSVYFRVPVRRGHLVFDGEPADAGWGVLLSGGLVSGLQNATAHVAAWGSVLVYANADNVQRAKQRHALYNVFS